MQNQLVIFIVLVYVFHTDTNSIMLRYLHLIHWNSVNNLPSFSLITEMVGNGVMKLRHDMGPILPTYNYILFYIYPISIQYLSEYIHIYSHPIYSIYNIVLVVQYLFYILNGQINLFHFVSSSASSSYTILLQLLN